MYDLLLTSRGRRHGTLRQTRHILRSYPGCRRRTVEFSTAHSRDENTDAAVGGSLGRFGPVRFLPAPTFSEDTNTSYSAYTQQVRSAPNPHAYLVPSSVESPLFPNSASPRHGSNVTHQSWAFPREWCLRQSLHYIILMGGLSFISKGT